MADIKFLLTVTILTEFALVSPVHAQEPDYFTAYNLQQSCSASQNTVLFNECISYVLGFNDAVQGSSAVFPNAHLYCLARNVTIGQMIQIFVKYSYGHPEELNVPAGIMFTKAMRAAFACAGT